MDGHARLSTKVRESVLFIGTQFSILYTSMYSPAGAASLYITYITIRIFQYSKTKTVPLQGSRKRQHTRDGTHGRVRPGYVWCIMPQRRLEPSCVGYWMRRRWKAPWCECTKGVLRRRLATSERRWPIGESPRSCQIAIIERSEHRGLRRRSFSSWMTSALHPDHNLNP